VKDTFSGNAENSSSCPLVIKEKDGLPERHNNPMPFKAKEVKERSIAKNLTISLFVLVMIVQGVLITFIYYKQANLMLAELEKIADDYAEYLSKILVVPIWNYDEDQIRIIASGFAKNEFVIELNILNPEKQHLFEYRNTNRFDDGINRSISIQHLGKPIGQVDFSLSLDAYRKNLVWFRNSIVLVLVTSLIAILFATGFLLRRLLRNPIVILQQGLEKVTKGDYAYEFKEVHHIELSGIAMRIKEMAGIIRSRELSLNQMNEELKQEIEIRRKEVVEKLHLESKLQRANKMEALGTLAGGVAHDLNNILSGIVSYPDLLLLELSDDSPLKKPLMTIKKSGEKAANIVQDLLTLARRGVAVKEIVNLNGVISQYLTSPEFEALKYHHPGISIEKSLSAHLFNIKGSPVHLSKTIMNLVANAFEATPNGGKVSIHTSNRYIDLPVKGYDDIEEGDYVVFTISDEGIGISQKDQNRIFEPFYSKKQLGRSGTGLGMAVVWGTIKDHNGYIDIESAEGKGTAFRLFFPVTREHYISKEMPLSTDEMIGNGQSVLIVDDIEEQREIVQAMLSKLKYKTDTVASGEEALKYLKRRNVDLLILDMIMIPGIDGLDTYREILKFKPDQKAIIASGYSETDRVKEAIKLGAGPYIKKPYTLETIGIAVKEALNS